MPAVLEHSELQGKAAAAAQERLALSVGPEHSEAKERRAHREPSAWTHSRLEGMVTMGPQEPSKR